MEEQEILEEEVRGKLLEEAAARRFLYKDVEELLEFGFLTHEADFGDSHVVFRTLSPGEIRKCHLRGSSKKESSFLRWCVASSVWMVNGFEVSLDPKDNGAWHIYQDWVADLPLSHVEAYIGFFLSLRNRMARALKLVEAFCYEDYSRALWRLLGKPRWEDANTVRKIWVAHNLSEDTAKLEDAQWHHTRMFVGSMSSKAAKELTKHMTRHETTEKEYRKKEVEKAVNWVIQGDAPEEEYEFQVDGKTLKVKKMYTPTSVAELEGEMRRLFAGEQDFHDAIVEAQNQKVRDAVAARKKAREEALIAAQRKASESTEDSVPLVGYTKEDLDKLNPEITKKKGTDTYSGSSEAHRLYEAYVKPKIVPGVMGLDLKISAPEASDPRLKKKEDSPPDLQSQIASRKPTLRTES